MPPPGDPVLAAFERNRYFYGMLVDVEHCVREQNFGIEKTCLLNRLLDGSGVVAGLGLAADPNGEGRVLLQPGVAIDGLGRVLVVASPFSLAPRQPTDAQGEPTGDPLATGSVELRLVYAEELANPMPVLVPECDSPGLCAPTTIREGFRVLVRPAAGPAAPPPGCSLGKFPLPPQPALHEALAALVGQAVPAPAADPSVLLGHVDLATGAIDAVAGRSLVLSSARLYELILCLAERVQEVGNGRVLRYASGDGQRATGGEPLPAPLVVELLDGGGQPVAGELVRFQVTSGGGSMAAPQTTTDPSGKAQMEWTLGPTAGAQEVIAGAVGSVFNVIFRAEAA